MNHVWQRFKNEMRNPRKATLLLGLAAVALLLWGRLLLEQVPQIATAEPAVAEAVSPAGLSEIWSEPALPPEPRRPRVEAELADRLPRDLFSLPREGFELSKDAQTRQSAEKLRVEATDESSRLSAVREAAAALSLDSIVTGHPPRAMINGRVVEPEQRIAGFTLVRIAQRFVLLEKDGVIVRLDL